MIETLIITRDGEKRRVSFNPGKIVAVVDVKVPNRCDLDISGGVSYKLAESYQTFLKKIEIFNHIEQIQDPEAFLGFYEFVDSIENKDSGELTDSVK